MERGTDWEREAVRQRWTELERRRRGAKRLLAGVSLLFVGVVVIALAIVSEACLQQGPWMHGCTSVVPAATRAVLFTGGLVATAMGLWRCWAGWRA